MIRRTFVVWFLMIGCGGPNPSGGDTELGSDSSANTTAVATSAATSTTGGGSSSGAEPTGTEPTGADPTGADLTGDDTMDPGPAPIALPPPNAGLDYQLGGAYPPPAGVKIVSRDRTAAPAPGLYNVCYVNGFQAQPNEEDFWQGEHPDLILRDGEGNPIIDADWNEMLLDIRTPGSRAALAAIVGGWIAGCAEAGYDAIEIDNLDSYSRSDGLLTQDHAVQFMALLSAAAHDHAMAIAQKNATELLDRRAEMDTDFAVAEECSAYDECDEYIATYGEGVLMIEYGAEAFAAGCSNYPQMSIVLPDLDLVAPDQGAYVFEAC